MWKSVSVAVVGVSLCGAGVLAWGRASVCTDLPEVCAFRSFKAQPPSTAADAVAVVGAMQDPVVRAAAVARWLDVHPEVARVDGEALCSTLSGAEQRACLRRVTSPHLRR